MLPSLRSLTVNYKVSTWQDPAHYRLPAVCVSPHQQGPACGGLLTCKAPPSALSWGHGPEVPRVHRGGVERQRRGRWEGEREALPGEVQPFQDALSHLFYLGSLLSLQVKSQHVNTRATRFQLHLRNRNGATHGLRCRAWVFTGRARSAQQHLFAECKRDHKSRNAKTKSKNQKDTS